MRVESATPLARGAALQRRLVRSRGPLALLLRAAAMPYGAAARLNAVLYDRGLRPITRVPVPVVSVGNLTVGGTGKTPLVARLAAAALRHGRRPAILLRGYRRRTGDPAGSDEALLYRRLVPDAWVEADPDRVAGARRALAAGADLLLLDDGFQHRRLARDVDFVLLDARDPFGGGRLLPAGRLREPVAVLRRATAVVLTRTGRVAADVRAAAREAVAAVAPGLPVFEEDHVPIGLVDAGGAPGPPLAALAGTPVFVFSGIADGVALAETLALLGARPRRVLDFGDHHEFTPAELERLGRDAGATGAVLAVTTEKDAVRIPAWPGDVPLVALRVRAVFAPADEPRLAALLGFSP